MELTDDNIDGLLPYIDRLLASCDYFALDLEFTGVSPDEPPIDVATNTTEQQIQALFSQTPDQSYGCKKKSLSQYSVMQIGFSIFTEEGSNREVTTNTNKQPRTTWQAELKDIENEIRQDVERLLAWDSCVDTNLRNLPAALCDILRREPDEFFARQCAFIEGQRRLLENLQEILHIIEPARLMEVTHTMEVRIRLVEMYERWTVAAKEWYRAFGHFVNNSKTHATSTASAADTPCTEAAVHHAPKYKVHTFYAHLFPADGTMFSTTSIDTQTVSHVLANHGMDFNKWIKNGLRFGTLREYNELRLSTWLDAHSKYQRSEQSIPSSTLLHAHFGNALESLMPLTANEWNYVTFVMKAPPNEARKLIPHTPNVIEFARLSDKLYASNITAYIENRTTLREEANALRLLNIRKANGRMERIASQAKEKKNGTYASKQEDFSFPQSAVCLPGTRLLAILLYAAQRRRKPLVLHSGYSDLFFLLHTLYGDLPPTLAEFKTLVHDSFPTLYDTRTLASLPALQFVGRIRGSLETVYRGLHDCTHFVKPDFVYDRTVVGGDDPRRSLAAHNAGFDAALTGMVYAYMLEALSFGGIDLSPYCNMLQLYCSPFAVDLTQPNMDALIAPVGTVFAFAYQPHGECNYTAYDIQQTCLKLGLSVIATHHTSGFLLSIFPNSNSRTMYCNALTKVLNDKYTSEGESPWCVVEIDLTAIISSSKARYIECDYPR